jgi:hypothetical protein
VDGLELLPDLRLPGLLRIDGPGIVLLAGRGLLQSAAGVLR